MRQGDKIPARLLGGLLRRLISCLALALFFVPQGVMGQDSAGEYELKAAMLYNLTRFVEWPESAYADGQAPTVLCILGRDPFGDALTSLVSKQEVSGRPVQIRHISNEKEIRGCHVVYISSSERKSIAQILAALKGVSVLTVGETAQFAARGGIVQFSLEERQVRFEINLEAASMAELKISSRLLVLARVVKDPNKNPSKEGSMLDLRALEVTSARRPGRCAEQQQSFCKSRFHVMAAKNLAGADEDAILS